MQEEAAAEKSRLESAAAEAVRAAQSVECELSNERVARRADEVSHMEKVAALEEDKARTISAMVEDKNTMLDRIKGDLDAQNQVC